MPTSSPLSDIVSTLDGDPEWESTKTKLIDKLKKLFIKSVDSLQMILDTANSGDSEVDPKVVRDVATIIIGALSASMSKGPSGESASFTGEESAGLAYAVTKLAENVGTIDAAALKRRILNEEAISAP